MKHAVLRKTTAKRACIAATMSYAAVITATLASRAAQPAISPASSKRTRALNVKVQSCRTAVAISRQFPSISQ
jgi:hypothetical protein